MKAPLPQRNWQSSGIRKQWKTLENDISKQDTNTALSFSVVEQRKHHAMERIQQARNRKQNRHFDQQRPFIFIDPEKRPNPR